MRNLLIASIIGIVASTSAASAHQQRPVHRNPPIVRYAPPAVYYYSTPRYVVPRAPVCHRVFAGSYWNGWDFVPTYRTVCR